jgi:hypothetical protein
MSIVKVLNERQENFSLTLHPETRYLSSSNGTSGSAALSPRPSPALKDLIAPGETGELSFGTDGSTDSSFDESAFLATIAKDAASLIVNGAMLAGTSVDVSEYMETYLSGVNTANSPTRNSKRLYITRFDPPFSLNDVAIEKLIIKDNLLPFYAARYDVSEFAYTNYSTLNFLTASGLPENSAIIYPNLSRTVNEPRPYSPTGSFSIDFYINPRYTTERLESYKAGTIFHLSSSFAVSLVSGSSRDQDQKVDGFRIALQLSHSADVPPSTINFNATSHTHPKDLVFVTPDNSLKRNNWHHVTIRWGGKDFNMGTGSILIDSMSTQFVFTGSDILPPPHIGCSALIVGNYYEGYDNEAKFFNENVSNEGVYPTLEGLTEDPVNFFFRHKLNAEVHELKIFNRYIANKEIEKYSKSSPQNFKDLMFYVPPMFIRESRERDVLLTPFQTTSKKTDDPFNVDFSFGVGGFVMNLENHTREFIKRFSPRLYNLTASTLNTTVENITATQFVYASASIRARNLTILPNDNGRFMPDYTILSTGSSDSSKFKSIYGGQNLSLVSIDSMISTGTIFPGLPTTAVSDVIAAIDDDATTLPDATGPDTITALIAGVTPESMGGISGPILTIAQRTRDLSSNEICFFDISNLFYGDQIKEESLTIVDNSLTGSGGKIKISLRDNGKGGVYRCDAQGPNPKWSNIGNCIYDEGIVLVKHPALTFFGKDQFEITFKGHQNIHIKMYNIELGSGLFNSSSNPQYKVLSASGSPSDIGKKFVYIDSLNLHDENLNIIMRANFAQPIKKRVNDSMVIRFKMDF